MNSGKMPRTVRIGSRGFLFCFPDLGGTNTLVIEGTSFRFFLDTFLGPDPIREIESYMVQALGVKTAVAFNSHADWDHIWGNSVFCDRIIIAHVDCRRRAMVEGPGDLVRYAEHMHGRVELVLPSCLFETRLDFPDEQVSFFHTPGHTRDSSSCFDAADGVLFAGDNVESPVPYVSSPDLEAYIRTLESYLALGPRVVVPGHGEPRDLGLVASNLEYLRALSRGETRRTNDLSTLDRHAANLRVLDRKS